MKTFFAPIILSAALLATSCASKPYPIGFHMEVDVNPGESEFVQQTKGRFVMEYKGKYYDRSPFISTRMFDKYASFVNPDGSYGVIFEVADEWRMRLFAETQNNINKNILPTVNWLCFEIVHISRPITDGKLVIWGGLNGYDLKMINETVKAVNPEMEEKRFLDKDPRPPHATGDRRSAVKPGRGGSAGQMDIPEG